MKSYILLLFIAGCILSACADNTSASQKPLGDKAPSEKPSISEVASSELQLDQLQDYLDRNNSLKLKDFNNKLKKDSQQQADWTSSPFQIAFHFNNDKLESRSKKIEVQTIHPENNNAVIATIIEDGFKDDSVKGSLIILEMVKKADTWHITKAVQLWECWGDRTNQKEKYSQNPCG